jgi:predicted enzyme related to lactoylglutathione lyase
MLATNRAFSTYSATDIDAERAFYADVIGATLREEMGGVGFELGGGQRVFIYPKPDHQPATFTVLNFRSNDFDVDRAQLRDAGVEFEHYDMPDLKTDPDGVMRGQGPDIAWFKDPAGNILSLIKA